uniref:Nascent polypeptide-associated complex subunit alpha-like n=1 Tax=Hirondellea gigas TaxID=1518452 RepID=A0A2P2ICT8_9CRUS
MTSIAEKAVIEVISDDEDVEVSTSVVEAPTTPTATTTATTTTTTTITANEDEPAEETTKQKQNRAEKKARKAMQKLGMKPLQGINRVTVKKSKNILFVITQPDVYKSPGSDTYIIFGEAKIEDLSLQAQQNAAQQFSVSEPLPLEVDAGAEDEDDVDETGLDTNDIKMVMDQANVSRRKAVVAMKNNDSDIVNAIMELTM